jgi:HKD family nuclease
MNKCLDLGGGLEFLVGLDMTTSEPEALWDLFRLCEKNKSVAMYCYGEIEPSSVYHPKLYFMNSGEEATAIVGSSNLTHGGLKKNTEINTVIHASAHEEIVSDILDVYNKLKFHPQRVEPDEELLSLYEQFCRRQNARVKDSATKAIGKEFKKK